MASNENFKRNLENGLPAKSKKYKKMHDFVRYRTKDDNTQMVVEGDEEETNMLEMEEAMSIFDDSPPINMSSSLAPIESQQVQTASKTNTVQEDETKDDLVFNNKTMEDIQQYLESQQSENPQKQVQYAQSQQIQETQSKISEHDAFRE